MLGPQTNLEFDQPNAIELLEQHRKMKAMPDDEFQALRHWHDYGYLVVRNVVPEPDIDGMMSDLD